MKTSHSDSDYRTEAYQPVWDGTTPQLYSERKMQMKSNTIKLINKQTNEKVKYK